VGWKQDGREAMVTSRLVEREPMWDGNFRDLKLWVMLHSVEREPMWDGNVSSVALSLFTNSS